MQDRLFRSPVAWRSLVFLVSMSLTFISASAKGEDGPVLRAGVAEVDITPPLKFPVCGYYHERLATGTIDPLKAKALVFEQEAGGKSIRAALVVCDITGIAADLTAEVRRRAAERTGIPAEHIQLSATHSHTGPDYTRHLYEYLADPGKKGADGDAPYAEKLISGIVAAIEQAKQAARPATVEAGSGQQQVPVAFNRRFVMKDGSVQTWRSLENPNVIRAAGPIDPEIGLVSVKTASGSLAAVLSNFALHLDTVSGTQWSADYPYFIEQAVRKAKGDNVVSIFGTGTCGDINHVNPSSKDRNKTSFIGGELGQTIVGALPALKPIAKPRLRVGSQIVELPLREVSPAETKESAAKLAAIQGGMKLDFLEQVAAYRNVMLDELHRKPPTVNSPKFINWGMTHQWAGVGANLPVQVHVICVGDDLAIVTLPGEVFVDLGLALKRNSPFKTTLVIELSNCQETLYIPTRAAYAGGSYEVTNSALKPGGGEMLVEAALELLRKAAAE